MATPEDVINATQHASDLTEQHKSLKRFAGTFRAEVRIYMGPGEPMVSKGTIENTLVLGERFIQSDYREDHGHFEGKGFWGYNTALGIFESFWIDTMATFFQVERGYFSGADNAYTMRGELPPGVAGGTKDRPSSRRSVLKFVDKDRYTITMFVQPPEGEEMKVMEIAYERV